jgi:hypothetical protein
MPGRVSDEKSKWRNTLGDDRSSTDKSIPSNVIATHNRGIGSNGSASANMGSGVLSLSDNGTPRIDDIREYTARPQENIIIADHTFVDGDVILNFYIFTQDDSGRNDYVLTNVASLAQLGTGHNMAKVPDLAVVTNARSRIYNRGLVSEIVGHYLLK